MVSLAGAGEEALPDPTASLHPIDAITALAKLRPLLAARPDDQRLLGLALRFYANLCLMGEPETDGGVGPWLGHAGEVMAQRVAARRGAVARTFAEAEPELWVRLVRGECVQVLDGLGTFPSERDTPGWRALYALASTDWRALKGVPQPVLHERYAGLRLGFQIGPRGLMDLLSGKEHRHNPAMVCEMDWRAHTWGDPPTIVREGIAFTAWMLASRDLPDDQAITLLRELAAVVGVEAGSAPERMALWREVHLACQRREPPDPAAIAVASGICDRLAERARGVKAPDGTWTLYGLGDLAAWNRDRLYFSAFYAYLVLRDQPDGFAATDRVMGAVLRKRLPGSLLATRYSLGFQGQTFAENDKPDADAWIAFADAIGRDLARPVPHGAGVLSLSISKLAVGRPDLAAPLLRHLLAGRSGLPPRAHLQRLADAAESCGLAALVRPALKHWHEQAPMDFELDRLWQRWSAQTTLLALDGRKPWRTWDDAQVDNRRLPWPGLGLSEWFAIRWRGRLRIERPGTYVLAVESDERSRLTVGDVVVENRGTVKIQVRSTEAEFAAGIFPLRLEYSQGLDQAGCRLLWQPPGAERLEPIPAANLLHEDGRTPGLAAEGFDQSKVDRDPPPTPAEIAFIAERPWHVSGLERVAEAHFTASQLQQAIPVYRALRALDDGTQRFYFVAKRLHQCLLWRQARTPDEVDEALRLIGERRYLGNLGSEMVQTTYALRNVGRLAEAVRLIGDHLEDDPLYPFALGYEALDRGDFATARDRFGKLLDEKETGRRRLSRDAFNFMYLQWAVLARLDGQEPDWRAVERDLKRGRAQPFHLLICDWLSGTVSWEESVARAQKVTDGQDLFYFRDLVALTCGDPATARPGFAKLAAEHPTWVQAPTCKGLLAWMDAQTPESLAKVATAKPIGTGRPGGTTRPRGATRPGEAPSPRPDDHPQEANDF